MLKKCIAAVLALSVMLCFSAVVEADKPETGIPAGLVTEYYSEDLTEPPVGDSVETAAAVGAELSIDAKSYILMEASSGKILYEKNIHEALPPASITKVMGLLLICEAIDSGGLTLDTVITADEHAAGMGGSQIWLEPGEQMTLDELMKAIVIGSANDATVAVGTAIAGSEEAFVVMMNERAKELGLQDTVFKNATGLDCDGHLTSSYDIAVMSRELIKHEIIKRYSTVWMEKIRDGRSELVNTNKLVRYYEGCTGLKTGTTSKAGACLTATAKRDGMELIAVVMGAVNSNERFSGAKKLLDHGFALYTTVTVTPDLGDQPPVKVVKGTEEFTEPCCREEKTFLIEKSRKNELNVVNEVIGEITAPVSTDTPLGAARVMLGDEEIGSLKITAKQSIPEMTFSRAFLRMLYGCFKV